MRAVRLIFATLLLALAAGCAPEPTDPLAWKIDAATPASFDTWIAEHSDRIPAEFAPDFRIALNNLSAVSPRPGTAVDPRSTNDPFCRRIHQHTVRAVIYDGLDVARSQLRAKLSRTEDNLLRNLTTEDKLAGDAAMQERYERARRNAEPAIKALKQQLEILDTRMKAYQPEGTK